MSNCGITENNANTMLFSIEVSPWLWYLDKNQDCKIYQNMSVVDILDEVLSSYGGYNYEKRLASNYRTREYCVQYEESDLDFISRLMEHEGIYYYKHELNKVTVILCNNINIMDKLPGYTKINFNHIDSALGFEEFISHWCSSEGIKGI